MRRPHFDVFVPEIARLDGFYDWIDLGFVDKEETPKPLIKLGIELHLAGVSVSNTVDILERFGVERARSTVHNWVQKVSLRNADALSSLAANKGYNDMGSVRPSGGRVRPLINHRVFTSYDHARNPRIDDELYHQRSTCESVNSSLKRSHGSAVRTKDWFRQFREITLKAGVHNVERAIDG